MDRFISRLAILRDVARLSKDFRIPENDVVQKDIALCSILA